MNEIYCPFLFVKNSLKPFITIVYNSTTVHTNLIK